MNRPLTKLEVQTLLDLEMEYFPKDKYQKVKMKPIDGRRIGNDMLVLRYNVSYRSGDEKYKDKGRYCIYKQRGKISPLRSTRAKPGMVFAHVASMQWTEHTGTVSSDRVRARAVA